MGRSQGSLPQVMLLGCDHLQQLYKKDNPHTDVLTAQRQQELAEIVRRIRKFQPDLIAVEQLPEEQPALDSAYSGFRRGRLLLADLAGGRSEAYQLGFVLGKQLGLRQIVGVNAPGGTSQSILSNGQGIELYREEGVQLRTTAKAELALFESGNLTLTDYLKFLNRPETVQKVHHLRYVTPARVTNGHFTNPDKLVDTAFVNPRYIGAELTAIFKNRDYKIYSNIVTTQLARRAQRVLVIIGVAHIGSLQSIFRDDPAYQLVNTPAYLSK